MKNPHASNSAEKKLCLNAPVSLLFAFCTICCSTSQKNNVTDGGSFEDTSTDDTSEDTDTETQLETDGGTEPPQPDDAGTKPKPTHALVCVFDIDNTLTCDRSAHAVEACKDVGAHLAVNTSESPDVALNNKTGDGYVDWAELGFPTNGKALALEDDAYIFGMCDPAGSCSQEYGGKHGDCDKCNDCGADCPSSFMGKAYGMGRIADYYAVEDKACLVLFDDSESHTEKVVEFGYVGYHQGSCDVGFDNEGVYEAVSEYLLGAKFNHCENHP